MIFTLMTMNALRSCDDGCDRAHLKNHTAQPAADEAACESEVLAFFVHPCALWRLKLLPLTGGTRCSQLWDRRRRLAGLWRWRSNAALERRGLLVMNVSLACRRPHRGMKT